MSRNIPLRIVEMVTNNPTTAGKLRQAFVRETSRNVEKNRQTLLTVMRKQMKILEKELNKSYRTQEKIMKKIQDNSIRREKACGKLKSIYKKRTVIVHNINNLEKQIKSLSKLKIQVGKTKANPTSNIPSNSNYNNNYNSNGSVNSLRSARSCKNSQCSNCRSNRSNNYD